MAPALRTLNRSGIALYPVDARGLIAPPPPPHLPPNLPIPPPVLPWTPAGQDAMAALAAATGGRPFYNTNDIQSAIRAAIDDSEFTYTLGFQPAEESLDSKFHSLKVVVSRRAPT